MFGQLAKDDQDEVLKALRVTAGEKPGPDGMVPIVIDGKFWFVAADELRRLKASGRAVWEVPLPEPAE